MPNYLICQSTVKAIIMKLLKKQEVHSHQGSKVPELSFSAGEPFQGTSAHCCSSLSPPASLLCAYERLVTFPKPTPRDLPFIGRPLPPRIPFFPQYPAQRYSSACSLHLPPGSAHLSTSMLPSRGRLFVTADCTSQCHSDFTELKR